MVTHGIPSSNFLPQAGLGEYQCFFIDKNQSLWGVGSLSTIGTNGQGTVGIPRKVAVTPSTLKFKYCSGALHGGQAIDVLGRVWSMGDNVQGQHGVGNNTATLAPQMITVDISGSIFNNVKQIEAFYVQAGKNGAMAVKNDGTLWVWGMCSSMKGDGTEVDTLVLRPTQIQMPGGRLVKQICCGIYALALCTDGTVWSWGPGSSSNLGRSITNNNHRIPVQVDPINLTNVVYIAGAAASSCNYAVKSNGQLYAWGAYGNMMGDTTFATGGGNSYPTPRLIPNITNSFSSPIKKIVTNYVNSYALLADGTLWGWGDNAQGGVGNGQELDYTTTSIPYAWSFTTGQKLVKTPYNICPGKKFTDVWGGGCWVFYAFARDTEGKLWAWGRNKGSCIPNRVNGASSQIVARYQNAWDIVWPQQVDPFNVPSAFSVTSPNCLTSPGDLYCNQYSPPANTPPTANAGSDKSTSSTLVALTGSASTDNVYIQKYEWTQTSGPNTASISTPGMPNTNVFNLINGTYTFRLKVTDTGWATGSDSVTVTKT